MTDKSRKQLNPTDVTRPERLPVVKQPSGSGLVSSRALSDLDRLKADPRGSIELAAAKLGVRFEQLIHAALNARTDVTQQQLAKRLGVSPGRVSQVLAGDENPRITTVARYLRALGYEAHVSLEPAEPDVPPVGRYHRANRREAADTSHVYVTFVTDGEATAPKFTVIPQSMSTNHVEITSSILLGEVTEDSKVAFRPLRSPSRSIVAGQSSGKWEPVHAYIK